VTYPLEGIRVLDFSRVVAGPFASRLLSDLGADVVKVEPPDGDSTRLHGKVIGGVSGFFNHQNAGKRNICLDLRAEGASSLVKSMAIKADIVIENYRPGVMQRLGIDYPALQAVNPRLLMLSISGYGQEGPEAHRPSYAPIVHAEAGLMHRLAVRNNTPPGDLSLSVADTNASLHGLIALLAALHLRDQTGAGQYIDMSMMDATFVTDDRAHFDLEDTPDTLPICPIYDLPFARVFIATDLKLLFRRLNRRAGLADPTPDGASLQEKVALREAAVAKRLIDCDSLPAFTRLMDTLDLPWGVVRGPGELAEQPTLKHRGMIAEVDDRAGGTRPIPQSPYRFSNAASGVRGPTAHRGEHNREVLQDWLDLNDDQIRDLFDGRILINEKD
jgi:CoA:oxalate CoA-transferase